MILPLPQRDIALAAAAALQPSRQAARPVAQHKPLCKRKHIRLVRHALDLRPVALTHAAFGRDDPVGKISVVGQKEQSAGVLVQTPDRKQPQPAQLLRQQIHHGFLRGVLRRGDHTLRLIHHIIVFFAVTQRLSVHADRRKRGIQLMLRAAHHAAVHTDPARADPVPRLAAAAQSQLAQIFVQPKLRHPSSLPPREKQFFVIIM